MAARVPVRLSLGLALLLGAAAAQAALPPKYQRLRELQAILGTPAVVEAFPGSEQIEEVRAIGPDLYRVRSQRCTLDVRIVNDPSAPAMPGPRKFLVKPGKIACKVR